MIDVVNRIFREQGPFMRRLAGSLIHDQYDAEDVVQNAALVMTRWNATVGEHVSDRTFAARMVRYARGMHARAEKSRQRFCSLEERIKGTGDAVLGTVESAEARVLRAIELAETLDGAPEEILLVGDGFTLREISEMRGQTMSTTWGRVCAWREKHRMSK